MFLGGRERLALRLAGGGDVLAAALARAMAQDRHPAAARAREGEGIMVRPGWPARGAAALIVAALWTFAGCGASPSVGSGSTGVGPTPTATASATPAPSCATILTAAAAAAAPGGFAGLQFPSGAVMTALHASYGGTGQFTVQETDVCYQGTPDEVNGPFSGHSSVFAYLYGTGWGNSTTFPFDGQTEKPCSAGASCFKTDASPTPERFLSFENLHSPITGFITYHLRLGTPPSAPTCNPTYYTGSTPYVYSFGGYSVPPLTRESDFAAGGGHAGGYTYGLCSAGTPGSILTFMQSSVQAAGNTPTNITSTGFRTCVAASGGYYRSISINVGGGNEWTMDVSAPLFTTASC
jgi:hypothetical protein